MPATINKSYVLKISFISALGGYLFGFDFAVIAGALPFLRDQFALGVWEEGFLTGSLGLGCIAGCLFTGMLIDRYGRKPGLLLAALLFAASSAGMAFAPDINSFIAMRFAAGIGVGMASMLSPMYIAEVSPAEVRGRNVAINQLTIVIGILVTNLINYNLAGHGPDSWRLMFGFGMIPALLFFIGVLWLPESPRWLIQAGKTDKARRVLETIGNTSYANDTVEAVKRSSSISSTDSIFSSRYRPVVVMGIILAVFQQLCGINVVFNYTSTIFESAGADLDKQLFETISIGIVNLVFTLLAMWLVDKAGRRPLMLFGSLGLSITYIILAFLLYNSFSASWISIFVLIAIAVYAISLAPVTWVLIAELFPNRVRGRATSVAVVSLWAAYFILVFTFPVLSQKLGTYGPFFLYAAICLAGYLYIRKKVRETKGKTLEQLEDNIVFH